MTRTPNTEDINGIRACVQKYIDDVRRGNYPGEEESFYNK